MSEMTARQFLEYAGYEVTRENLGHLSDYVDSPFAYTRYPNISVYLEDGTNLAELPGESAEFQKYMDQQGIERKVR